MTELRPILRDQRKIDADHLNLLSIFHFVASAFAVLGLLGLAGHYAMFRMILANPQSFGPPNQANPTQGPPPELFAIMQWFYLIAAGMMIGWALMNVLSGVCIRRRQNRVFSLVVAGFDCLFFPIGTVLGVFTFVVLLRDSVRELYEAAV